jgi:iron complex outermembrane receptor protein
MAVAQAAPKPSASSAATASAVGEVVVTAQRREQRLRDVPLSITSHSGEKLATQGIRSINELTLVTPGLKIDETGAGFVVPALRGVSTGLTGAGAEPNVAVYVDGVYQPNSIKLNFDFADISRIEVDKGPQGTLFGRNATGGAIAIFTESPSFTPHGHVSASYGRFNDLLLKGFATGPITNKVAGSLSAYYASNDDYYFDLISGRHDPGLRSQLYRGKLLFRPTESVDVTLNVSYLHKHDGGGSDGEPYLGNTEVAVVPGVVIPRQPWQIALNYDPFTDVQSVDTSVLVKWTTSLGVATSLTSYDFGSYHVVADSDYAWVPHPVTQNNDLHSPMRTFQQEFNFASRNFGRFSFISGLFIWHDKTGWDPILDNNILYLDYDKHTFSVAVYGEGTLEITDKLSLIGGLRYSHEQEKSREGIGIGGHDPTLPPFVTSVYNSVTPRASLRYKFNEHVNGYFTFSEGFKSGEQEGATDFANAHVVNGIFVIPFTIYSVDPETINAYELGLKGGWRRWSFNAAVYYYDYQNQQVPTYINQAGLSSQVVANAASSSIYGLDFDADARVTDDVTLSIGVSVLDAKYDKFLAQVNRPIFVEYPVGSGQLIPAGNAIVAEDVSGNRMVRAPKWTLSLAADYHHAFDFGVINGNVMVYHSDRVYYDPANRISQPPYTIVNARLGWEPRGTNFQISLWGRNLSNVAYISGVYELSAGDGVNYAPPRTYGVEVAYHF